MLNSLRKWLKAISIASTEIRVTKTMEMSLHSYHLDMFAYNIKEGWQFNHIVEVRQGSGTVLVEFYKYTTVGEAIINKLMTLEGAKLDD